MKILIDKKAVGKRIQHYRKKKRYTLKEFGKLFNSSDSSVVGWENGRSLPNKEKIQQIAKLADISINELLYGSIDEFVKTNFDSLWKASDSERNRILKVANMSLENYINFILFAMRYNIEKYNININNIEELIEFSDFMINKGENDEVVLINNFANIISELSTNDKYRLFDFMENTILKSYSSSNIIENTEKIKEYFKTYKD